MNASDKIMFENEKKEEIRNKRNVYVNLHLKNHLDRIHSLLMRAYTRGSADIIYRI